jgi:dihydrofolate reductase
MRRIVTFNNVSADGYFAAADGNLDWVVQDPELSATAAGAPGKGTLIFGRRTYDMFESFWPRVVTESPTAPDPHGGAQSPEMKKIGVWINEATKLVFSKSRKDVTWKNSRLLRELVPKDIEALKRESGPDILIFGSGTIASQLTQLGLIDEYQFVVNPILLGGGRSLLTNVPKITKVKLEEVKQHKTGNVMLRYVRAS